LKHKKHDLEEESMRRAFRVATVFTGTAACAAGFAPAAMAAKTAKTEQAEPATSHWNCAVGPRTKATVFWWPSTKGHGPTCVGGANGERQWSTLGTEYSSYCPGDNWGYFHALYGGSYRIHPGETKHALNNDYVSSVYISRYSGSDKCAT
jgi:hypothetical protein